MGRQLTAARQTGFDLFFVLRWLPPDVQYRL
jgi:hypothetical protein